MTDWRWRYERVVSTIGTEATDVNLVNVVLRILVNRSPLSLVLLHHPELAQLAIYRAKVWNLGFIVVMSWDSRDSCLSLGCVFLFTFTFLRLLAYLLVDASWALTIVIVVHLLFYSYWEDIKILFIWDILSNI